MPSSVQKAADDMSSAVESEVIKIENRFDGYADTDKEDSGAQNPTVKDSPHN